MIQSVSRQSKQGRSLFHPGLEPFLVTTGLFAFTLLYYTRTPALQVLSAIVLVLVTAYWSIALRRGNRMSLADFKLTRAGMGKQLLIAAGLAVFGWFWFRLYVYWTRGELISLGFGGSIPAIIAILLVSTAEEVFFRGYLQNRLAGRYGLLRRVLIAVFAMALYKNAVHMWGGMGLVQHVELLLIGILHNILPSLWMEWSGSLVGPLALHVFWDLLVYAPLATIPAWVI